MAMAFWLCNPRIPQLRRSPRLRESRKASPQSDIATRFGFGDCFWTLGRQVAFQAARLTAGGVRATRRFVARRQTPPLVDVARRRRPRAPAPPTCSEYVSLGPARSPGINRTYLKY